MVFEAVPPVRLPQFERNALLPPEGRIGHNPGMSRRWSILTALVVASAGCSRADKPPEKPPLKPQAHVRVDEFNLPLEITIDAPKVPPEIERPSPPIRDDVDRF